MNTPQSHECSFLPKREYPIKKPGMSFNLPVDHRCGTWFIMFLAVIILTTVPALAAPTSDTYIGDMVLLSGYSYGSDTVYLFLTGPNLPTDGVALNNVNRPTSQGGFTTVDVNSDGSWSYKWYTGQTGGKLDAGAYTVWVVDRPVGRSNLGSAVYSTITVNLLRPGISTGTSSSPGGLEVNTTPAGASLFLNGKFEGATPLTVPDLDPGTYVATLSNPGYLNSSVQVEIQSGALTTVTLSLLSKNGTLWITTAPVGGTIAIDGNMVLGAAPVLVGNLTPGNHTVTASMPGYSSARENVTVVAGATLPVSIPLVKENQVQGPLVQVTNPTPAPGGAIAAVSACTIIGVLLGSRRKKL